MLNDLDFRIKILREEIRRNRQIIQITFLAILFFIVVALLDFHQALISNDSALYIGIGAILTNIGWAIGYISGYIMDQTNNKKTLKELEELRGEQETLKQYQQFIKN